MIVHPLQVDVCYSGCSVLDFALPQRTAYVGEQKIQPVGLRKTKGSLESATEIVFVRQDQTINNPSMPAEMACIPARALCSQP